MAEFAALPFFTDAWIADTAHLSRIERGIYMDLLVLIWRSPECRVPNEIDWIARRLRAQADEVPVLQSVLSEFCITTGNWLTQKRLQREWSYTSEKRKKNIASAKSRWKKEKEPSERSANAMPPHPHPHPHPHPSSSLRSEEPQTPSLGLELAGEKDAKKDGFDDFWKAFPKKAGKPAAMKAWQKAIKNTDPGKIIAAAKVYAGSETVQRGFIKFPQGWLNEERFNDPDLQPPVGAQVVRWTPGGVVR